MHNNIIPPKSLMYMAPGLQQQANLEELNLDNNRLRDQNLACLLEAVSACNGITLHLNHNKLKADVIKEIFGVLNQGKKINTLAFRGESIDEKGMREIARFIKSSSNLKQLYFCVNECVPESAAMLEEALIESGINEMYLSDNDFCSLASVNVNRLIKANRNLSKLGLYGEDFNAGDIAEVLNELIDSNRLQCFSLREGEFDEKGVAALVAALRENNHLLKLNLAGCWFPPDTGEILCNAIRGNTSLEIFKLDGSNLDAEHQGKITNICERNRVAKGFLQKDALLCSRMVIPEALPAELGALLANQVLMRSDSTAEYEAVITEIALSLRALAPNTQDRQQ